MKFILPLDGEGTQFGNVLATAEPQMKPDRCGAGGRLFGNSLGVGRPFGDGFGLGDGLGRGCGDGSSFGFGDRNGGGQGDHFGQAINLGAGRAQFSQKVVVEDFVHDAPAGEVVASFYSAPVASGSAAPYVPSAPYNVLGTGIKPYSQQYYEMGPLPVSGGIRG